MLYYIIGGLLVLLLGGIFIGSFKFIMKLLFNSLIGGILLMLFNSLGSIFGLSLSITPITALITGFLGAPGILLMLIFKYLI